MQIANIKDGRYTLNGGSRSRLTFTTDQGDIVLSPKDALEIATCLFDWADQPYDILYDIEEYIETH